LIYTDKNLFYRNKTKSYFSRSETKRNDIFFGTETENRKPKRNKYFSETNRNETKKKLGFLTPASNREKKVLLYTTAIIILEKKYGQIQCDEYQF
jgi:hypothetical protein